MTLIVRRKPLIRQPSTIPQLNRSNPITNGLVFAAVPVGNTFIDLVTGVMGTPAGGPIRQAWGVSNDTPALGPVEAVGGTAQTQYVSWPASSTLRGGSLVTGGTYSMLAWAAFASQPAGVLLSVGGTTETDNLGDGPYLAIDTGAYSANGRLLAGRYQGVADGGPGIGIGSSFSGRMHSFGLAGDGSSSHWFANGSVQAHAATVGGTTTAGRRAWILKDSIASSGTVTASVALFLTWTRRLSVAEYYSLYKNPWQILKSEEKRIWVPSSAVSAPSLIIKKEPWTRQPTRPITINSSNSLAKDLRVAYIPGRISFGVGVETRDAGTSLVPGVYGNGFKTINGGDYVRRGAGFSGGYVLSNALSVIAFFNSYNSNSGTTANGVCFSNGTYDTGIQLSGGYLQDASSGATSTELVPIGRPVMLGLTRLGYESTSFIIDGRITNTVSDPGYSANGSLSSIGGRSGYSSADMNVALVLAWSRRLTAGEIRTLHTNPWQIFAPQEKHIWVPGTTGGIPTILPSGIVTTEAFGTDVLTRYSVVSVSPSGVGSAQAFGTHVLTRGYSATISAIGLPSLEGFGTHTLTRYEGAVVVATAIATTEAFGNHVITTHRSVSASGIPSVEVVGTALVSGTALYSLSIAGIASAGAFGTATLSRIQISNIIVNGIASSEVVPFPIVIKDGTPVVSQVSVYRFLRKFIGRR